VPHRSCAWVEMAAKMKKAKRKEGNLFET